jgi:NAD(P)-dependent dehydrogenase (short-subunit alcohol dehydrogenase family)
VTDLGLAGAIALVTGGARGVGRGITDVLHEAGVQVVVCGRTAPSEDLPAEFRQCDVRDPDQVSDLVQSFDRLDILVNNAGGAPSTDAAAASPRFHARVVELNLLAPLSVAQAANAVMQRQETGGAIVNVSSVSGHRASPGTAAYAAAKAGLDSLTATLAVEWAPRVRVNSVVAGMVLTEQAHLHYGDAHGVAAVAATVPLARLADPREIGACVAFLASPLASYVSGACLLAHGGGERPAFLAAASETKDT